MAEQGYPEKLGELIANMSWMAAAKVVKCVLKNKSIDEVVVMEGFLLDKIHGTLHVEVIFCFSKFHDLKVLNCILRWHSGD